MVGRSCVIAIVLLILGGILPGGAMAGGGQAYKGGAEAFLAGALPPPGFTFVNYMYYYNAEELKDSHGDDVDVFDEVTARADILRLIWVSKCQLFGASYAQHLMLFLVDVDLDFKAPVGPAGKSHYSDTDVPFVVYSPFILGWHLMQGQLHFVFATDFYIPFYNEESNNLASLGRNFWTFEPVLAMTWMPTKQWEASIKMMYDFNTNQDDFALPAPFNVDRTPGQEFHFDYSVSYALREDFRLGVSGFFYQQVTDDDFDLDDFDDPVRGVVESFEDDTSRVWAIGPGIWYNHKNIFLTLRSQFELAAENMSEGYNVWFKFYYVF